MEFEALNNLMEDLVKECTFLIDDEIFLIITACILATTPFRHEYMSLQPMRDVFADIGSS
jgi:hypothetical protein